MISTKKIKEYIVSFPIIDSILRWSKKYAFPGFDKVPIYNVVAFIIAEAKRDSIVTRAEAVAFSFFLSIFPFSLFLLPILSRTPFIEDYIKTFSESVHGVLPQNAETYIVDILNSIQLEGQTGWLTVGFFFAIFFASNGMSTLMTGFDKSYDQTFRVRNYFEYKGVAILLTLLLSFLFVTSIILIVLGQQVLTALIDALDLSHYGGFAFNILRWFIMLILFYAVITSIYRFGPSMYKRIRVFSPGATLATFFSILSSVAFSYFVNTFNRYNELYGSIGALIVILLWLELNAFILLVGFELNASIAVNRDLRSLNKD